VQSIEANVSVLRLATRNIYVKKLVIRDVKSGILIDPKREFTSHGFVADAFQPEGKEKKDREKKSDWKFSFGNIQLREIALNLKVVDQLDLILALGELDLKNDNSDFTTLAFHFDRIMMANSTISITQKNKNTESSAAAASQESAGNNAPEDALVTSAGKISLENITFRVVQEAETAMDLSIGSFLLKNTLLDQGKKEVSAGSVRIENSGIDYAILNAPDTTRLKTIKQDPVRHGILDQLDWGIVVKEIDLNRLFLSLHHAYVPDTSRLFDPRHLEIKDLNFSARNIMLNKRQGYALIRNSGFSEARGFKLNLFKGELSISPDLYEMKAVEFKSDFSHLLVDARIDAGIGDQDKRDGSDLPFELRIVDSWLGKEDLDYFSGIQEIPEGFQTIKLDLHATGILSDIRLDHLDAQINEKIRIRANGTFSNILDRDNLTAGLRIEEFSTSRDQLLGFVPALDSFSIFLPDEFLMEGFVGGSFAEVSTALSLATSNGGYKIDAFYRDQVLNTSDTLGLTFSVDNYNLSQILRNGYPESVSINGWFGASGIRDRQYSVHSGMDILLKVADTLIHPLQINGFFADNRAMVRIQSPDPLLGLDMKTEMVFQDTTIFYDVAASISSINLYGLGLIKNPFVISSTIYSSGKIQGDRLDGKLKIDSLLFEGSETYVIRRIFSDFVVSPDTTMVELETDNISGFLSSNIKLQKIPVRLRDFLKKSIGQIEGSEDAGKGKLNLDIRFREPFHQISRYFPDFDTIYIEEVLVDFDEERDFLNINMGVPDFQFRNYKLDSLMLNFLVDQRKINYLVDIGLASTGSINFSDLEIRGFSRDSVFHNQILKKDSTGKTLYFAGMNLMKLPEMGVAIIPFRDSLILNAESWDIGYGSQLMLDQDNRLKGEIDIYRESKRISARIDSDSLFYLDVINFELGYFRDFLGDSNDNMDIVGTINLQAVVQLSDTIPDIDAKLSVTGLTLNQMHLGEITAEARNDQGKNISIRVLLENEGNRIRMNGHYDQADQVSPIELDLDIDISTLSAFESFAAGTIRELEGKIQGKIQVEGDLKDYIIHGALDFKQVEFFSKQLNGKYSIDNESLEFLNKDLRLRRFTITDSLNNDFTVDGTIGYLHREEIPVDMHILAENFTVYNAGEKDNPELYGQMIMSVDARMTGNLEDPKVILKLAIEPGTDMTYVRPPKEINLVSHEDIVEFNDPEAPDTLTISSDLNLALQDSVLARLGGFELVADLAIRAGAGFKMVIDPNSGDYIRIKGNGDLNIQVQEGTDPMISGVYEIKEGVYQVSFYGLVQKSFNILDGSTLIWAGDPMNARMNLVASSILRTSSTGLVAAETAGLSDEQINQYRKTLPYEVKILIKGTFQEPELDFEIDLIDENRAAYPLVISKLNQINGEGYESQLTQQVFGLLTIGSFIPEQTFDSSSGGYGSALATTAAANSLNGILAGEFNKLSGKYLKGVDLDIGLQSYSQMSSGRTTTQTTMDVKFSKNLFNDRVTLEAQTSFDVSGDKYVDPIGDNYSNFQSDFAIKYDITPKGDYKLKAFNKSSYDIIYKDIWSTGIAIIFVKEFDKLSEIRKGRKDNNKRGQ
jgi:translocation and assembly module TamB